VDVVVRVVAGRVVAVVSIMFVAMVATVHMQSIGFTSVSGHLDVVGG